MATLLQSFVGRAALAATAVFACAGPQDSKPASRPESAPASGPASRPQGPGTMEAARAFLKDAAARRAPKGEPNIQDVTIRFEATSDFDGQHVETDEASHRFLRPNRIRTQLKSSAAVVDRGYDGTVYWLKRGDQVVVLSGRDTEKDRKEIDHSIRFTTHLIQMISLGSLADRIAGLELLPSGESGVRGRIEDYPSTRVAGLRPADVELRFDPKTLDLAEVRAWPIDEKGNRAETPETVDFSDVREVKGTRFPHRVEAWTKSKTKPEYRFQILGISWNDGLAADLFAPPK